MILYLLIVLISVPNLFTLTTAYHSCYWVTYIYNQKIIFTIWDYQTMTF